MHRALFLDRDGIINIDLKYVGKIENFVFEKGIFDLVKSANFFSYKVIVVTNQSGIGRGFYSEKDFFLLTKWMKEQFALNDGYIDKVYFCPHHPKFSEPCTCRKPATGLLEQATKDFKILKEGSVMVGDKEGDIICANNFGIRSIQLSGNYPISEDANHICKNWYELEDLLRTMKLI